MEEPTPLPADAARLLKKQPPTSPPEPAAAAAEEGARPTRRLATALTDESLKKALIHARGKLTTQIGPRIDATLRNRLKRFVQRNGLYGLDLATETEVIEAALRPFLEKYDRAERFAPHEALENLVDAAA
jgi:hypothetical protein